MARVVDCIETTPAASLRLDDLARAAALSPFHFLRMFRRTTGMTPHAFVAARRLQRARQMLLTTRLSVAAAAHVAGYANPAHFRRAFRRAFGTGPRELAAEARHTP